MSTTVTKTGPIARTHSVALALESDELHQPDFDIGRPLRPERLRLTWVWGEECAAWRLDTAQVVGPRLKNDGTPSQQQAHGKRNFARRYSTTGEQFVDDTPDWVRELVEKHAPGRGPWRPMTYFERDDRGIERQYDWDPATESWVVA